MKRKRKHKPFSIPPLRLKLAKLIRIWFEPNVSIDLYEKEIKEVKTTNHT